MNVLSEIAAAFSAVPEWVPVVLLPALLSLGVLLFTLFGGRRAYPAVAVALAALGAAFLGARSVREMLTWGGIFLTYAALLSLFFLLPVPKRRRGKGDREARIYEKFRLPLREETPPPKVCCFEETPLSAEESGVRLEYVAELIERLKNCKLTPSDRLELDVLSRAVEADRGKSLDGEQLSRLNDRLAAVLRLTASYKL